MADLRGGAALLLSLPDDVLAAISSLLLPGDLLSLARTCRSLLAAVTASDKAWLAQCLLLPSSPPPRILPLWRSSFPSYLALLRFLHLLSPLLGLWAHQNPELGNAVIVLWGHFPSLLALRIIPQELPPMGLESGPLLFAPVFEILPNPEGAGSPCFFFLHGSGDSIHPGTIASIHRNTNVLLLEVDNENQKPSPGFAKLAFGDRRRLLDFVARRIRVAIPADLAAAPMMLRHRDEHTASATLLEIRRKWLLDVQRVHSKRIDRRIAEVHLGGISQRKSLDDEAEVDDVVASGKRRRPGFSVAGYLKDGLKQLWRSKSFNGNKIGLRSGVFPTNGKGKHVTLPDFLRSGDTVWLSLRGVRMRLMTYHAWPSMHDNKFALYKLSMQAPEAGREFAGLWGGSFGWPPGKASEDKPGKALFFLLMSYEEVEGRVILIATKILEGTHYVLHPNGSAMFIVKVDEPSVDQFPWDMDGDLQPMEVKNAYNGEGISNGYGFRYPGSKPGSLFVLQNGLIAFVWRESKAVLTLQRLDLEELLKKGERVSALPPVANFAYLTKSYSNVFAGCPSSSAC